MAKKIPKKQRGIFERPADSGIWWICYFDQYGRKHREKVGMRSAALEIYRQRKEEVRQDKFKPEEVKNKHRNALLSELIDDRLPAVRMLRSARTELARLEFCKRRLGDRPAKSITLKDIEAVKIELKAGNDREAASERRPAASIVTYRQSRQSSRQQ